MIAPADEQKPPQVTLTRQPFDEDADIQIARASLALEMRRMGVTDERIVSAIEHTPRHLFVARHLRNGLMRNTPLPIECGQTLPRFSEILRVILACDLFDRAKILEIGSGSGYQTALFAMLAGQVFSFEIYEMLCVLARERLKLLERDNVEIIHGNGLVGYADQAVFSHIVLNGSLTEVPGSLFEQLAENGKLIAAIGKPNHVQQLICYRRDGTGLDTENLGEIRMVPLRVS